MAKVEMSLRRDVVRKRRQLSAHRLSRVAVKANPAVLTNAVQALIQAVELAKTKAR